MQIGRVEIFTDEREITSNNIISVMRNAFMKHQENVSRMNYLLDFEAGDQPQIREKQTRKDIDVHCIDNVAHQATEFNTSFHWSNPITWVQRGIKDSGSDSESEAIALLNECYSAQNAEAETQKLGRFIEICGLGYVFVDINMDYEEGESYFTYNALDPRNTFVVKSSSLGHKVLLGVTYSTDTYGNNYFTCFTKDARFEIYHGKIVNGKKKNKKQWLEQEYSGQMNPIGMIPIIECIRDYDRMGCFEREIPDMLSLNLLESDMINATDETVQAIWHCNDVDFPVEIITDEDGTEHEVTVKPEHNDWLQTYTTKEGKTPFVTPLSITFDYAGNLSYANSKRSNILEKLCIPQRNSTSGGSTGVAMDSATGWNAAENLANKIEAVATGWKMEEIKVVLSAIKKHPDLPDDSPIRNLRAMDVKPNIKRNKNYELTVKSNAFATMVSHGVNGLHALNMINAFPDNNQVWTDSKYSIEAYQKSIWDKSESQNTDTNITADDQAAQVTNSPLLDGMNTSIEE